MTTAARVHAATGLWLGAVLVVHVVAALLGPRSAREAVGLGSGSALASIEVALVLAPMIVHAVTGLARARSEGTGYASVGARLLQQITGVLTLVSALAIAVPVLLRMAETGSCAIGYEALRERLDRPMWLVIAITGATCACFHLAQGLVARVGRGDDERAARLRSPIAGVALLVWLLAVDGIAFLASGRALLFTREPASEQDRAPAETRSSSD